MGRYKDQILNKNETKLNKNKQIGLKLCDDKRRHE